MVYALEFQIKLLKVFREKQLLIKFTTKSYRPIDSLANPKQRIAKGL